MNESAISQLEQQGQFIDELRAVRGTFEKGVYPNIVKALVQFQGLMPSLTETELEGLDQEPEVQAVITGMTELKNALETLNENSNLINLNLPEPSINS
ncbi:hypothetical protein N836_28910 [Leptolyngbya sp. Heron Island J]|uniref:hypothetical protein n=1 Tax=Leptolyngbya sp. Heron Island J TaxID=1385935 RepID=UPI0003B9E15B|nr:hypothetical protein [Leptolyngbya sp. Heron Island J]ESA39099.1 hypothetical protein N836_28910 [Leptolyngbya sp. Heron Island J]